MSISPWETDREPPPATVKIAEKDWLTLIADAARWRCALEHVNAIRETPCGIAVAINLPLKRVNKSGPIRLGELIDRLIEESKREG